MHGIAAQGRYFPLAGGPLASKTKSWRLAAKARLVLRNPERALAESMPLAKLRPGRDLTLFSLPVGVDPELGRRAASHALDALARWKDEPAAFVEGRSRAIIVYLQSPIRLRVVEHRLKYSRRKFGAGEGLGTSRKLRVTSDTETELAMVSIV
jgi:hypothetical protein